MARCSECGKKGLFLRVNKQGLCPACAAVDIQRKHAEEAEIRNNEARLRAAAIEKRAMNAQALLAEAMDAARTEAQRQLEIREQQVQAELAELTPRLAELQDRLAMLTAGCEQTEKKMKTAENRIIKAKAVYKSMQYAMDAFMDPASDRLAMMPMFACDLAEIVGQEPELKCLTMKTLRAMYRQNEKKIVEVTEAYQAHYTTKANATIYKLMVMALHAEMNLILTELSFGKMDAAVEKVKAITSRYYVIASEGNQSIVGTLNRFIGQIEALYIEAVRIEYEYYVQRERAKEEQRALREQMRQEAEERKQLEAQRKQVENEEKKYQQEMNRVQQLLEVSAEQQEIEQLKARLAELTQQMRSVSDKKEQIINLQNGKAGTVYIISNLGSFGDDVFKIGMTRRLEPQERVNELGDASVPFPFDVHSFIFSEDAVALENALHKELNAQRVNKVNLRKEFFHVSLDDLEALVARIDPSAPFQRTMLAEQYHQSLSIDVPDDEQIDLDIE
ncbi:MAG: GIY-YIG nuclease family protein [Aristaeellaceae bacterium]